MSVHENPFLSKQKIVLTKVGIVTKRDSIEAIEFANEIIDWLKERHIRGLLNEIDADMDLIIVLGGDGTLLRHAEQAAQHSIPVIGVNLGSLGFLTEVSKQDTFISLETIINEDVCIEHRLMVRARIIRENTAEEFRFALNEVVITKNALDRILQLTTTVDGQLLSNHKADGLIFSTPTGATAYNLSAGGPLVYPSLATILVTPICPFMLSSRPVILPATKIITTVFHARDEEERAQVLIDGGMLWEMRDQDKLEIQTAGHSLQLIVSENYNYFSILRKKLYWGSQSN